MRGEGRVMTISELVKEWWGEKAAKVNRLIDAGEYRGEASPESAREFWANPPWERPQQPVERN